MDLFIIHLQLVLVSEVLLISGALVKKVICGILVHVILSVTKCDEYLDIKYRSCKKHFFGKLVLTYEDEISNSKEIASFVVKKVTHHCLVHAISLVIIRLLLVFVIYINCYY